MKRWTGTILSRLKGGLQVKIQIFKVVYVVYKLKTLESFKQIVYILSGPDSGFRVGFFLLF